MDGQSAISLFLGGKLGIHFGNHIRGCRESEARLVEFRALNITCVLVSLACPISSDVFIYAKRSSAEELL